MSTLGGVRFVWVAGVLGILGFALGGLLLLGRDVGDPPSRAHVSDHLVLGGELLTYEVWDGVPHVVFRDSSGRAVRLDHLRKDWISIEFPPAPAWQLSGDWYTVWPTNDPASVGVVRHDPTELFGLVNSEDIVTMEVEYEGEWHAFDVEAPAFLLQLPGFDGTPTGYRWIDDDGNVVWSRERASPLRE